MSDSDTVPATTTQQKEGAGMFDTDGSNIEF